MFQINAVLNLSVLDDILQGLHDEGFHGVTVSKVRGKGCLDDPEGDLAELSEKVIIKIVVADTIQKEQAMEAIRSNAQEHTTQGAGKIWVIPVLEVERIRTGEKNADALSLAISKEIKLSNNDNNFDAVDTPTS